MSSAPRRVECSFLIPLVRNSDRTKHSPTAWRLLQDTLRRHFGGLTGPERVINVARDCKRGEYTSPEGGVIEDESHRYTVAVEPGRVDELRVVLRRAANTFDQIEIYLSVRGDVEFVAAQESDGVLTAE